MELKPYQAEALDTLRRFLEDAQIAGPAAARRFSPPTLSPGRLSV